MPKRVIIVLLAIAIAVALWWLRELDASRSTPELPAVPQPTAEAEEEGGPALATTAVRKALSNDPWMRWWEEHPTTATAAVGHVGGHVLEEKTNTPIAGATVTLFFSRSLRTSGETRQTVTDAEGRFRLPEVSRGRWVLVVTHPRYVALDLLALAESTGEARYVASDRFVVHVPALTGGAHLRKVLMRAVKPRAGRVVDERGEAVPGAHIIADLPRAIFSRFIGLHAYAPHEYVIAVAGSDGRFELPCLPKGIDRINLGARTERHVGVLLESVSTGPSDEELVLVVHTSARLSGRLLYEDGTPAAGVSIDIDSEDDRVWDEGKVDPVTDAEGRFRLLRAPTGDLELDFYTDEPWADLEDRVVPALQPAEHRSGLEFRIAPRRRVYGRLLSASGRPLAHEAVSLSRPLGQGEEGYAWIDSTDTDDDGAFALYTTSDAPHVLVHSREDSEIVLLRDVQAPAGPLQVRSSQLEKRVVEVQVVDPEGRPVPAFRVAFRMDQIDLEGDEWSRSVSESSGKDGRAKVRLFGPPPWTILVTRPQERNAMPMALAAGQAFVAAVPKGPIVVQLAPVGQMLVEVVDEVAKPLEPIAFTCDEEEVRIVKAGPGRFRLLDIPRHARWLRIDIDEPPGYVALSSINLHATVSHHRIALRRGVHITGHVVAPAPLTPEQAEAIVLEADWEEEEDDDKTWAIASVGPDGSFRIDGLPPGAKITLRISDAGDLPGGLYFPGAVMFEAGDEDVVVKLKQGGRITVDVELGDGASFSPSIFARLMVGPGQNQNEYVPDLVPVKEAGSIEYRSVPPGTYELMLTRRPNGVTIARRQGVRPGQPITLTIPRSGTIRGRVPAIRESHHVFITAWHPTDARLTSAGWPGGVLIEDPEFVIEGLASSKPYTLLARESLAGVFTRAAFVTDVLPGGDEVELQLLPAGSITGRAVGPAAPLEDAMLYVHNKHVRFGFHLEEGRFDASGLPPGRWDLTLLDDNDRLLASLKDVPTGTTDIVLPTR